MGGLLANIKKSMKEEASHKKIISIVLIFMIVMLFFLSAYFLEPFFGMNFIYETVLE